LLFQFVSVLRSDFCVGFVLQEVLDRELVATNMMWIVENGLAPMMAGDALAELALMYRLLGKVSLRGIRMKSFENDLFVE
jgi:hypothetical protein